MWTAFGRLDNFLDKVYGSAMLKTYYGETKPKLGTEKNPSGGRR